MKARITNIWLEESGMKGFGAIRLDFSNDYHCRIEIENSSPEKLSLALERAAFMVKSCDHRGLLEVQSQSDAWNDAGTKPDHPCLCETILDIGDIASFQYWNGEYWGFACGMTDQAMQYKNCRETTFTVIKWREVQS